MLGETRPFLVEDWPRLSSCARTFQLETAEGRGECVDRQRDGGGGTKKRRSFVTEKRLEIFHRKEKKKICTPHTTEKGLFL